MKYIAHEWQNHESFKTFIKISVNQQTIINHYLTVKMRMYKHLWNSSELQFAFGQYVIIKLLDCVKIVTLFSGGQLHDLKILLLKL